MLLASSKAKPSVQTGIATQVETTLSHLNPSGQTHNPVVESKIYGD